MKKENLKLISSTTKIIAVGFGIFTCVGLGISGVLTLGIVLLSRAPITDYQLFFNEPWAPGILLIFYLTTFIVTFPFCLLYFLPNKWLSKHRMLGYFYVGVTFLPCIFLVMLTPKGKPMLNLWFLARNIPILICMMSAPISYLTYRRS